MAASVAAPLLVGALFWVPALSAARGFFPAPLDDVYIHFDFARSLAEGHPFEWIPGNGYSSGETSPLYAAVLALGWLVGFHGRLLGVWAAVVAVVALSVFVHRARALMRPLPSPFAWVLASLPLSVGLLDWSLFSGMETATFVGVLGIALVALAETRSEKHRRRTTREGAQWKLGGLMGGLCLLRPEAMALASIFAIIAARGAGARSGLTAFYRAVLPAAIATGIVLALNHSATGRAAAAGAELKLLSSNPFLSDVDRARALVENLAVFFFKGLSPEFSRAPWSSILVPALALAGVLLPARRAVASAAIGGAVAWTLVVSWNGNSPHHNFRYYAPALLLLFVAVALGIASIAERRRHRHAVAVALVVLVAGPLLLRFSEQTTYFRRAVANVRDQQIEVGMRLGVLTASNARVLLGDAGAIPFVSNRPAIDALGLGGYRALPFARAAVHGEAATIELIERLEPRDRPSHMALYPNWFGTLTSRFGTEIDRVTIRDNVICGGITKGIYLADWSALDVPHVDPNVLDEIDIGDVVSETEHAYEAPTPAGGWTTFDILDARGTRRFDGGRIIPEGKAETFSLRRIPDDGRARIVVRTGQAARGLRVRRASGVTDLSLSSPREGAWTSASAILERLRPDERISLEAASGEYRDYHVWIERLP